jgi:hypothetical protein
LRNSKNHQKAALSGNNSRKKRGRSSSMQRPVRRYVSALMTTM